MWLPPEHPDAPKYWMNEAGGKLAPAVERYLRNETMTVEDCRLLVLYFQQWVNSPVWDANLDITPSGKKELDTLRRDVATARTLSDIDACTNLATDLGIDPF